MSFGDSIRGAALAPLLFLMCLFCATPALEAATNTTANVDSEPQLLALRSFPWALTAGSGRVDVAFKIRFIGKSDNVPKTVTLVQSDNPDNSYPLNDSGENGDFRAGDGIYSGSVQIDSDPLAAETCLEFGAGAILDNTQLQSPPYSLCVTRFADGFIDSDTSETNRVKREGADDAVANELLLRYVKGSSEVRIADLVEAVGGRVAGSILPRRMLQLVFPSALSLSQLKIRAEILRGQKEIENAYLNAIGRFAYTPSDVEFPNQHGLQTINADDAWDANATGSGVTVTILDSGIAAHTDLPVSSADSANHGTAVAGIVAADTNDAMNTGIAGIAHGSALETFTVSADTAVTFSEMVSGFQTVASSGSGSIVNASFYHTLAPPTSDVPGVDDQFDLCGAIDDVVLSVGVPVAIVVVAAGNDGTDGYHYPARCNDSTETAHAELTNKELLITVASSVSCAGLAGSCAEGTADNHYSGSNHGAWIDVYAPGTVVRATDNSGSYSDFTGTSFAAPMVAAAAAILQDCGSALNQIETSLENNGGASVAMPAAGNRARIDINAALAAANNAPSAIDISALTLAIDENVDSSGGLALGPLTTTDVDSCDSHQYSAVGGDAANFSFAGASVSFDDGILDYETTSSYTTTIRSTDAFGQTVDQPIVISVNDLPEAVDIVLVMDRSGSMNGPSAVTGSKLMALQSAANLFVDQIAMDSVHRLGLVQFNSAVVPFVAPDIFPFGTLNPGNVSDAHDAINSISAGGGTNVLDGLQQGVTELDVTPSSSRRIAVLFTDGRHNSPSVLADPAMQTELETRINAVSPSMELYSIGFGTSISEVPLTAAASANDGWHVNEVDPLAMAKNFTQVAADVIDDQTVTDPVFTLKPGQSETLKVPVSEADTDLTFIVHWDQFDPARINTVITAADDKCELDLGGAGVKRAVGINYLVVRVDLPYACAQGPAHAGAWQVRVNAGENNRTAERVDILAYASSAIRLQNQLKLSAGELDIRGMLSGSKFSEASFTAYILPPLPATNRSSENDRLGSDPDSVGAIPKPEFIKRSPLEVSLKVEPCDPDPATCPEHASIAVGSYSLQDKGLYQVRLVSEALDGNGQTIRREQMRTVYFEAADPFASWQWWLLIVAVLAVVLLVFVKVIRS